MAFKSLETGELRGGNPSLGVVSISGSGIIRVMEHGPMGPVSALRETSVLGCLFLREKLIARKLVAALLIVVGAALLHVG